MSEENKKEILGKELDPKQLNNVSGGRHCLNAEERAMGPGSCTRSFYVERCQATVEKGSDCGLSNDYCESLWNLYTF